MAPRALFLRRRWALWHLRQRVAAIEFLAPQPKHILRWRRALCAICFFSGSAMGIARAGATRPFLTYPPPPRTTPPGRGRRGAAGPLAAHLAGKQDGHLGWPARDGHVGLCEHVDL